MLFLCPEGWHIVIDSSARPFVGPSIRPSVRQSVRQSLFCPEHNFKAMHGINMKLHR